MENARDALLARGEAVSIDAVRAELGNTGSKTTLHRHLKTLASQSPSNKAGEDGVSLSDELAALIAPVAERLEDEANQLLNERTEAYEALLETQREEVRTWREKAHTSELDCAQLTEENTGLNDTIMSLNKALSDATHQIALQNETVNAMTRELSLQSSHIASLEKNHEDARQALTYYRESVAQQREREQQKFDNTIAGFEQRLRTSETQCLSLQDNLQRADEEKVALSIANQTGNEEIMRLKNNMTQLQDALTMSERDKQSATTDLATTHGELTQLTRECAQWREAQHAMQDKLSTTLLELAEVQATVERQSAELKTLERTATAKEIKSVD